MCKRGGEGEVCSSGACLHVMRESALCMRGHTDIIFILCIYCILYICNKMNIYIYTFIYICMCGERDFLHYTDTFNCLYLSIFSL